MYALGDEEGLRSILQAWERSPEAVKGIDVAATRLRMTRRIAQMEEQLAAYDAELAELRDSPLGKLKAMVDEAASRGNRPCRRHGAASEARHHGRAQSPRRDAVIGHQRL